MQKRDPALELANKMGSFIRHQPLFSQDAAMTYPDRLPRLTDARNSDPDVVWQCSSASFHGSGHIRLAKSCPGESQNSLANTIEATLKDLP